MRPLVRAVALVPGLTREVQQRGCKARCLVAGCRCKLLCPLACLVNPSQLRQVQPNARFPRCLAPGSCACLATNAIANLLPIPPPHPPYPPAARADMQGGGWLPASHAGARVRRQAAQLGRAGPHRRAGARGSAAGVHAAGERGKVRLVCVCSVRWVEKGWTQEAHQGRGGAASSAGGAANSAAAVRAPEPCPPLLRRMLGPQLCTVTPHMVAAWVPLACPAGRLRMWRASSQSPR